MRSRVRLAEGSQDARLRQIASQCYDALVKHVSSGAKPKWIERQPAPALYYDGEDMEAPDEVYGVLYRTMFKLVYEASTFGKRAAGSYKAVWRPGKSLLTVYVRPQPSKKEDGYTNMEQMPPNVDLFWNYLKSDGGTLLQQSRTTIVHELTHAIDRGRIKDPKFSTANLYNREKSKAGDDVERGKYVNSPLELNASFQEAISQIEHQIKQSGARSWEDVKRYVNADTPQQFAVNTLKTFPQDYVKRFTPESRRKVLKRLYQVWNDWQKQYAKPTVAN